MTLFGQHRKSRVSLEDCRRRRRPSRVRFIPLADVLESRTALSSITVNTTLDEVDPNDQLTSLREAIAEAAVGNNAIKFSVSGTITLSLGELVLNKNLDIQGPGANSLTISGQDQSRVFDIQGSGVTVTIAGLTIAHGRAQGGAGEAGRGGGILMESGTTLKLTSSTLENNQAWGGTNAPGEGGAIYMESGATLTVDQSYLQNNTALGGSAPAVFVGVPGVVNHGGGGAIVNNGGQLAIDGSDFKGNLARGGPGVIGGFGVGGAINNEAGATLTVASSTFADNRAVGGPGLFSNGSGFGGALFNLNATLITTDGLTQITNNRAGSDTTFGLGGGLFGLGGSACLNHARITGNRASIPLFNDVFLLFSTISTSC
jgi:CSLREA domain-containing protein